MRIPLPVKLAVTAFAPVFVVLWIVAEAGRAGTTATALLALLIAAAIGLSPWRPFVAVVVAASVPVLQLPGLLPSFTSTDWPLAFGALIPIAFAGFDLGPGRWRRIASASIGIAAIAFGLGLAFELPSGWDWADRALRAGSPGTWLSWIGTGGSGSAIAQITTAVQIATIVAAISAAVWLAASGVAARIAASRDRTARDRAERNLADAHLEQAIVGERARIARDVHDAMAHSLAIVIAQADGALASGVAHDADAALATIAETARRALADVRDVLERIDGDGPALGARDLPDLVETVRSTGLDVRMSISGEPDAVPTVVSLAAYRIVQEALTNTLRHTVAPATADVTIDWRGACAVMFIASSGVPRSDSAGAGRGIAGMTERARMLGGWLSAGRSGDEFVVTATLPYPASFAKVAGVLDEAIA